MRPRAAGGGVLHNLGALIRGRPHRPGSRRRRRVVVGRPAGCRGFGRCCRQRRCRPWLEAEPGRPLGEGVARWGRLLAAAAATRGPRRRRRKRRRRVAGRSHRWRQWRKPGEMGVEGRAMSVGGGLAGRRWRGLCSRLHGRCRARSAVRLDGLGGVSAGGGRLVCLVCGSRGCGGGRALRRAKKAGDGTRRLDGCFAEFGGTQRQSRARQGVLRLVEQRLRHCRDLCCVDLPGAAFAGGPRGRGHAARLAALAGPRAAAAAPPVQHQVPGPAVVGLLVCCKPCRELICQDGKPPVDCL
mmetsp:Transcript_22180/g.61543  ORF Transcript_22180/g.61543 Transcript_22180/m.61543 type:complete len:298 (+) Transcript_22180:691-1584(+)